MQTYFHPETENYKYWSSQEELKLESLIKDGHMSYEEVGKIMCRTSQSCQGHASFLGLKNKYIHKQYSKDENFWSVPNLINCYWAGFGSADASISQGNDFRLEIQQTDRPHIVQFLKDCKYTGTIKDKTRIKKGKEYSTSRISISSCKQWLEDLKNNFNLIRNKTKCLAPPNLTDFNLKLCYVIGYTDGDGTICLVNRGGKQEITIRWCSCSLSIINWMKETTDLMELYSERKTTSKTQTSKNGKYHAYAIAGRKAIDFVERLRLFSVPKLARKWENPEILKYIEEKKLTNPELFLANSPEKV